MKDGFSLIFLYILCSGVFFLLTACWYYRKREEIKDKRIKKQQILMNDLRQQTWVQSRQIAELRQSCASLHKESFQELGSLIERSLQLKDENKARKEFQDRMEEKIALFRIPEKQAERERWINEKTAGNPA